jgi:hypothetical protein
MCTYSKPLFFTASNISWNSYLPRSVPVPRATPVHSLVRHFDLDPGMVNIWYDLFEFSRAANISSQTGRKLEPDLLQEVIISVQYRLLNLEYDDKDVHELLRVVLLAYSTTILPLLFVQFGAPSPFIYPSLESCLQRSLIISDQFSNEEFKVWLWLLVVMGISVPDSTLIDPHLAQIIKDLNLSSWDETRVILKETPRHQYNKQSKDRKGYKVSRR